VSDAREHPEEMEVAAPDARIEHLAGREGVRSAVLVDRSGRVIAEVGVGDRKALTKVATLIAGLHATGARLLEGAGDPGRSNLRIRAGAAELLMVPLPPPSTHVLLVVTDRVDEELRRGLPALAREMALAYPGLPAVTDPTAFEASLTRRSSRRERNEPDGER
jgi:hypothetical protein